MLGRFVPMGAVSRRSYRSCLISDKQLVMNGL